jgi:hypothetical protein
LASFKRLLELLGLNILLVQEEYGFDWKSSGCFWKTFAWLDFLCYECQWLVWWYFSVMQPSGHKFLFLFNWCKYFAGRFGERSLSTYFHYQLLCTLFHSCRFLGIGGLFRSFEWRKCGVSWWFKYNSFSSRDMGK